MRQESLVAPLNCMNHLQTMHKWTIEQVPSQRGKVAIVTVANRGIGYETTLGLVKKDVEVIMGCRNRQKG